LKIEADENGADDNLFGKLRVNYHLLCYTADVEMSYCLSRSNSSESFLWNSLRFVECLL